MVNNMPMEQIVKKVIAAFNRLKPSILITTLICSTATALFSYSFHSMNIAPATTGWLWGITLNFLAAGFFMFFSATVVSFAVAFSPLRKYELPKKVLNWLATDVKYRFVWLMSFITPVASVHGFYISPKEGISLILLTFVFFGIMASLAGSMNNAVAKNESFGQKNPIAATLMSVTFAGLGFAMFAATFDTFYM